MSQLKAETTKIGDHEIQMFMLDPMTSHELLVDVATMVGPALGPVLDSILSGRSIGELDGILDENLGADFFTKATKELFSGLNKKTLREVIETFRKVTYVDGIELEKTFAEVFRGELDTMYKWIAWGMGVQWGKSLIALVGAIPSPRSNKGTSEKSKSPMASTG